MEMGKIDLWRVKKVIVPISPSLCRTVENTKGIIIVYLKRVIQEIHVNLSQFYI